MGAVALACAVIFMRCYLVKLFLNFIKAVFEIAIHIL